MKKLLIVLVAALCCAMPVLAQSKDDAKHIWDHGDNVSNLAYHNVTVYKVLDHSDAYVVLYAKKGLDVGKVTVPKKWFKEIPRKLEFRNLPKGLNPYMTVMYKDDSFMKVIITVPQSRLDAVWGVTDSGTEVEGTDSDTLNIEY